tara:strand:+ start:3186 stop:8138 length:4953 start_codon:yes stop_codon:yes gene_type:complete
MPKQLKELRIFQEGTISAPSAVDIPDEAPKYSKNIEPLDEEGKLKGAKKDIPIRSGEELNRYIYFINNSETIAGVDIFFQASMFKETIKGVPYTLTGTDSWLDQKTQISAFAELLEAKSYIKSAKVFSYKHDGNETVLPNHIVTASTLMFGINDDATTTTLNFHPSTNSPEWEPGTVLKLVNADGTFEYMTVFSSSYTTEPTARWKVQVSRASTYGTTTSSLQTFTTASIVYTQSNWAAIEIIFDEALEEVSTPKIYSGCTEASDVVTLGSKLVVYNFTPYLDINARNMILVNSRDDNSDFNKTNIVYYNKDNSLDPPEYKIKVIKNFYKENDEPRLLVEPTTADVFSTNEGYPETVSLAKGPNAVYIGNGSTSSAKAQWLGEIGHEQFGLGIEGYHLEEAELKSIDDGQSVFSLSYFEIPHQAASHATAPTVTRTDPDYLLGIAPEGRYIYAMHVKNIIGAGAYGKQFKIDYNLGWVPTAIGSSKTWCTLMATTDTSQKFPLTSGAWIGNNATTFTGHDAKASYFWTAREGLPEEVRIMGALLKYTSSTPSSLLSADFGVIKLDHYIEITLDLVPYSNLALGTKISRKPKSGSYISDLMEKNGKLYIQYSHKSGFTFDEEWLYVVNISEITALDTVLPTAGGGSTTTFQARPITPPTMQVKNWGNDYMNWGQDWWMSDETFDGSGLNSEKWIGQDGVYGSYSNFLKWRNTDFLGFRSTGKHVKYSRQVDTGNGYETKEKDNGGWHTCHAGYVSWFSASEDMRVPGYSVAMIDGEHINGRDDNNPYLSLSNGFNSIDIAPAYGYEVYSAHTKQGGLFNYTPGESTDGDIGASVFIDAKQITSGLNLDKDRKSTQVWFTYKRRHALFNKTEPTIEDISEQRILTVDYNSLGVSQRLLPFNSGILHRTKTGVYTYNSDTGFTDDTTAINNVTGDTAFEQVNGILSTDWGVSDHGNGTEGYFGANTISGRIAPQRNAWRYGHMASVNPGGNWSSSWWKSMHNRMHIKLTSAGSVQSGQSGNSVTAIPPNDPSGDRSCGKMYHSDETRYVTTAQSTMMQATESFISLWTVSRPTGNGYGRHSFAVSNHYNPLRIPSIGQAISQVGYGGDGTKATIYIAPTAGAYQSGYQSLLNGTGASTSYEVINSGNAEYGDYFYNYPDGSLDIGLTVNFSSPTPLYDHDDDASTAEIYQDASFMAGVKYYWKMSLLYDGYQEGPLSAFTFSDTHATRNHETAVLTLEVSNPPKRASHIILYRKNTKNDFYRIVKEVDFAKGWAYNHSKDCWTKLIVDEGGLGATYEAITGIPETLFETTVNYKISVVAQGHLVVADCYHPEIKQGQNFIFKSETNAFSNFNWSKNYCVLPTKPTTITWFAGKLYAFDLSNMYRVNLNNLVLEDTFEGTGCISPDSLIVTDIGMFFCDYQGLYWHNGSKAETVSMDIATTSSGGDHNSMIEGNAAEDESWDYHAWQTINHNITPKVLFDAKTQTVWFCFQDKHRDGTLFNGAWKFGLTRKRLDLQEIDLPLGTLTGNRNDVYTSGNNKLVHLAKNSKERKLWSWWSKDFDLGLASQDKNFISIKVQCNNSVDATLLKTGNYGVVGYSVDGNEANIYKTSIDKNSVIYKIQGDAKKGKKLSITFSDMEIEVDSIAIIHKMKNIK